MSVVRTGLCFLGLSGTLLQAQVRTSPEVADSLPSAVAASGALDQYARLPLSFVRTGGSEFVARAEGYAVQVRGARATITAPDSRPIGMEFVRGREGTAVPQKMLPGKVNYIHGNDPRLWRLGLATYERVTYHDLYPGVDVTYYGNGRKLEFDLMLKPDADVRAIRLRFSGVGTPRVAPSGSLLLGDVRLLVPKVIQGGATIDARYKVLESGDVIFELGAYDPRQSLVIDPMLVYSTRLGGGTNSNEARSIFVDGNGNAYIAGSTFTTDFPVAGAAFAGYKANREGFIAKLNATGTALIYSTYIGGSNSDELRGIAADSTGAAWAVGNTTSTDFPLLSAYQSTLGGGTDAVAVKLSPTGSLVYSTFLGGPNFDSANAVAVDPFGNAYVTGEAAAGFPTTAGVYQTSSPGGSNAFVTEFGNNNALLWSTFVGGTSYDIANGIAVDNFGNSYIAGRTYSTSFPNAPPGGAQPATRGDSEAFVAKLNLLGSGLLYFTFLGGSQYDQANAIAVDPASGIAVVAGQTLSTDLSTTASVVQPGHAGANDGFVAKLNAAGTAFVYLTYLGGSRNDYINAVAIDSAGNAYVAGQTHSGNFPTSMPVQSAIQGNSTSLFRTLDTGASWTPFDTTLPSAVSGLSPDPVNAGTLLASTENGVFRTTNDGLVWTRQSSINLNLSRSLAVSSTVYGISGTGIYQSTDNGVTWQLKGSLPQCCGSEIVADPIDPATAYVYGSSTFGVYKTVNNGVSWSPATVGLPANQNIGRMVAGSDGTLYVALRNAIAGMDSLGVYKSSDHGGTWVPANVGLSSNFPYGNIATARSAASVVYITDFFTLYKSTNAGGTWTVAGSLPVSPGCIPSSLAVSATNPSVVYFAPCYTGFSQASLWVSTNSGSTWTPASGLGVATVSLAGVSIIPDSLNGARAYAMANVNYVAVMAKLDAAGQHLLNATYLGDRANAWGIATNAASDAFVTGSAVQFPVTPGVLQANRENITDVFVARVSDATAYCTYSVDPAQTLLPPWLNFAQFSVTAGSGSSWTASSDQPWASIVAGGSGTGSGLVYVRVTSTSLTTQAATLTIAGQSVTLRQLGRRCGGNSFSPQASVVPGSGGTVQFNVTAVSGCDWTVVTNHSAALNIRSGASGTGNGTVVVDVSPNFGPNTRTLSVYSPQGGTETISQAGTTAPAVVVTIVSTPPGASITSIGDGCIPGTYTTPASLTWNANTNCTIRFTTPQSIGGSQYTFYSASVNGGSGLTANPLVVNSGSNNLTVSATFVAPCTYSLSPSSQSFTASGGISSFTVNTAPTCSWKPVASSSWITLLPSGSTGTGVVNYAVAANGSTIARNGFISVGDQQHNISQQGFACTYQINPSFGVFDNAGGDVRVTVTAAAGCAWTAVSNAGWLQVMSGAAGSGNGTVVLRAQPNVGSPRSGTATIAVKLFSATQGAGACGALDMTSKMRVYRSGLTFIYPSSYMYSGNIAVTNSSGGIVRGPVWLVLLGLPTHYGYPNDSGLIGNQLLTTCFSAQGDYRVLVSGADMAPNQQVGIPLVFFTQRLAGLIQYSTKVLSGTPTQ